MTCSQPLTHSPHPLASCLYKAKFYDITSGICLSRINISECNRWPFFDSAKDHVVSARFRLCKMSSWKDWDTIPQPENYCIKERDGGQTWIYFGEHAVFRIPEPMLSIFSSILPPRISGSLLALTNSIGQVVTCIIKLPSWCHIEQ